MNSTIANAFNVVPRERFLPDDVAAQAHIDMPLSIGFNQTNSQPTTVRMMLEWLDPQPGDTVLDVGAGSGWTTALLAHLVGQQGRVIGVEKIPELARFSRKNLEDAGVLNAVINDANSQMGWPPEAPYDRILVSAAAEQIPKDLLDQLIAGGRMVVPVKNSVIVIDKDSQGISKKTEYPGFAFVPLR